MNFNYRSFNLVDIITGEFNCFTLTNSEGYKLQGCTRNSNWQSYAQEVVDNYYEYLSENLVY